MQAVILAGGLGTRMRPLTETRPKPLVELLGKVILDHIVAELPPCVNELVLVVGYRHEDIMRHCGRVYGGRPVRYVLQEEQGRGTARALADALPELHNSFLVLNGDDLLSRESLTRLSKTELGALMISHDEPERFGVCLCDETGGLLAILEKPEHPPCHTISTGTFLLDSRIGAFLTSEAGEEAFLSQAVSRLAKEVRVETVVSDFWFSVGRVEDIPQAERVLRLRQAQANDTSIAHPPSGTPRLVPTAH